MRTSGRFFSRSNIGRRLAVPALTAVLLVGGGTAAARSTAEPQFIGSLGIGDSTFWDGEYVASARGGFPAAVAYYFAPPEAQAAIDPCLTGSVYCRLYELDVTEPGGRLRIALDSSKRGECFAMEVRDPSGVRTPYVDGVLNGGFPFVCPEETGSFQAYDIETVVPNAAVGTWEVRVLGIEVEDWAFRMRAAVEGPPRLKRRLLKPNLVPWLPDEFGFVASASPNAGTEIDRRNPPGLPGTSCHQDEAPASKCLRFTSGNYNVGDGPLYLAFRDDLAFQHVYYSDATPETYLDNEAAGNYLELPAGTAEYHESHGHRHYQQMVLYELFAVVAPSGPSPGLTRIGKGGKHGYCTFAQRMLDWTVFAQDGQFASISGSTEAVCNTAMSQERGWGDNYRWQRPGQHVPYDEVADPDGTMRAGRYVVRVTMDPEDLLLETREHDNAGYAYIEVIDGALPNGDRVVICERGFGKSPWDPKRRVVEDAFLWAKRMQDPGFLPEAC